MRNGESRYVTLAANAVTTVLFEDDDWTALVLNRDASSDVYFTLDGSDPVIDGDNTEFVPASSWVNVSSPETGPTTVKLISSGTPKVYIKAARDVGGRR